jgi:hypothetical protein
MIHHDYAITIAIESDAQIRLLSQYRICQQLR